MNRKTISLTISACLIYAINAGIRGNYGILLAPISENSGVDYASISFVLAVAQLSFGIMQPVFGVLSIKKSNVFVLRCGIMQIIAGLILLPMSKSMMMLLLALGIMIPSGTAALSYGIIMGTITPLLSPKVAPTVSGVVSASSGIGSAVFAPVLQTLSAVAGLLGATLFLGLPTLLLLPVTLYISKLDKTLDTKQRKTTNQSIDLISMLKEALQSRDYLYILTGFFTCGFHMAIIETHLYTQITTYGFSKQNAAFAFSIYGIATIIGSISSGMFCSQFPMKNVLGTLYTSRIVWIAAFLLLPKNLVTIYAFATCLGLSGGATVSPTSGITGNLFGTKKLATLFGIAFFCHQVGSFFSAWLGGICLSATGGYSLLWIVDAMLCVLAAIVSFSIQNKN